MSSFSFFLKVSPLSSHSFFCISRFLVFQSILVCYILQGAVFFVSTIQSVFAIYSLNLSPSYPLSKFAFTILLVLYLICLPQHFSNFPSLSLYLMFPYFSLLTILPLTLLFNLFSRSLFLLLPLLLSFY